MIEIDLRKLERGKKSEWRTVHRGGKTFQQRFKVGRKETSERDIPPSKKIMDIIRTAVDKGEEYGFTSVTEDGSAGWDDITIPGSYEPAVTHIDFKVSGNTVTNIATGKSVTLTDKFLDLSRLGDEMKSGALGLLGDLDISEDLGVAKDYNKSLSADVEDISDFVPEYSEPSGDADEMKGKYSPKMGLKYCSNIPTFGAESLISSFWLSGAPEYGSLIGENVRDIMKGEYNKDNILHSPLKVLMETSKTVSSKYGSDNIYRGETNINSAKSIIEGIDSDGSVQLSDKVSSWSENEKLAKWYSSVHKQRTPGSQTETKSHVMLKLDKDNYSDNVVFDYRACGSKYYPEQEVTIYGGGVKLTGDNVMVNTKTPKRKTKKWMTFNQFKSEGGSTEEFINQMRYT